MDEHLVTEYDKVITRAIQVNKGTRIMTKYITNIQTYTKYFNEHVAHGILTTLHNLHLEI